MANLNVQGTAEVRRNLELIGKNSKKVISKAINEGLKRARTDADKQIRTELNLKKKDVFAALKPKNSTATTLVGTLAAEKKGRPMSLYTHTVLKRGGFTVKISKQGARAKFPTGVKLPASVMRYSGIPFLAQPISNPVDRRKRLEWLYGPSVSQAWTVVRDEDLQDYAAYALARLAFFVEQELLKNSG